MLLKYIDIIIKIILVSKENKAFGKSGMLKYKSGK